MILFSIASKTEIQTVANMRTPTLHYAAVVALLLPSQALAASYTYDAAGRLLGADYGTGKSISYGYDNAGNLIQATQPAPALLIARAPANQLTVSWLAFPAGFALESTLSLAPANWQSVNAPPAQVGNYSVVTVTNDPGGKFYRLRK